MRKFFLLFVVFFIQIFSQKNGVTVANLQPKSQGNVFPKVSIIGNRKAEVKINFFLQYNWLDFIPNSSKNPFKNLTKTKYAIRPLNFYSWEKMDSPSTILTLKLDGDATGAYTEEFISFENFDIKNGNTVNIKDVFTLKGFEKVQKLVNETIKSEIDEFVNFAKNQLKNEKNKENINLLEEQIFLYQTCKPNNYPLQYVQYYFLKNKMIFVRERCSAHVNRAIDDLDDFEVSFSFKELKPYLSDYGKELLFESKNVDEFSIENRIFKGRINNSNVTFVVGNIFEDGSLQISYWYDNYKEKIELRGSFKNKHFSLIENDYHDENLHRWIPRALIEADLKGKKIIGTWQDYKTKEYLKLELNEY